MRSLCLHPRSRNGGNTRHHFGEILFIALAAVLCGVRTYELMEGFAELRGDWLRKWLKFPNGIPCYNTFSRVFQAIEPAAFAACIAEHNQGRLHDEIRDQFAFALRQLDPGNLDPERWSFAQTKDHGHDRCETRQIMVCHDLDWMDSAIRAEWQELSCIIMVHRHTLVGAGRIRSETSY